MAATTSSHPALDMEHGFVIVARVTIIAGAYPAAPQPWSKDADHAFLTALVESPGSAAIGGLELPWQAGAFHAHDERWFLSHLPQEWRHVVTMIPDTMITSGSDRSFGLASSDEPGRQRAIEHARVLRDHLDTLCQHEGRQFAAAVEVHSAPAHRRPDGAVGSSADALRRSLEELTSWDWNGVRLILEHCDAAAADGAAAKGFLPLADELSVVDELQKDGRTGVGVGLNWGRSVIEGRSRATAIAHIEHAGAAGHLDALVFSGVAAPENGMPWLDNHLPSAEQVPESLLTADDMRQCLQTAIKYGRPELIGVKMTCRPTSTEPVDRARDVLESVAALDAALAAG